MPSPEYGQPVQHLSTRLVPMISEAFIYILFIASLWIIHLSESTRNMNATRGDRIGATPALNLHAQQEQPHASGRRHDAKPARSTIVPTIHRMLTNH
jgi:hypothetical protein